MSPRTGEPRAQKRAGPFARASWLWHNPSWVVWSPALYFRVPCFLARALLGFSRMSYQEVSGRHIVDITSHLWIWRYTGLVACHLWMICFCWCLLVWMNWVPIYPWTSNQDSWTALRSTLRTTASCFKHGVKFISCVFTTLLAVATSAAAPSFPTLFVTQRRKSILGLRFIIVYEVFPSYICSGYIDMRSTARPGTIDSPTWYPAIQTRAAILTQHSAGEEGAAVFPESICGFLCWGDTANFLCWHLS